jgi:parallel beta-helix repeat protein
MQNCRVANCVAANNGWNGFFTGNAGGPGPFPRSGCKLTGCTATENGQDGFNVADASTVENCVSTMNQNDGIDVGGYCYVLNNQCDQNGFPMFFGAGIRATGNNNRIDGNSATRNSGAGIDFAASIGNLVVRNSASGNAPDYNIGPGNNDAAIVAFPGGGFFAAPWVNFQY